MSGDEHICRYLGEERQFLYQYYIVVYYYYMLLHMSLLHRMLCGDICIHDKYHATSCSNNCSTCEATFGLFPERASMALLKIHKKAARLSGLSSVLISCLDMEKCDLGLIAGELL